MNHISFSLTEPQFLDGTKDVTRRLGWCKVKAGDKLLACRRCMGLKLGENRHALGIIQIVSVRRERLDAITQSEVVREGFVAMSVAEFIEFFCASHKGCTPSTEVTRIEFQRQPAPPP